MIEAIIIPTEINIPATAPWFCRTLDLVVSCSSLPVAIGGLATMCVTIVKEPLASDEVLMIVTSGGVVKIFPPLESVVVRAIGVESVKSGCVVMVLVQAGALPLMIVTEVVVKGASADERRVGLLGTGSRELEALACDVDCEGLLTFVVNDGGTLPLENDEVRFVVPDIFSEDAATLVTVNGVKIWDETTSEDCSEERTDAGMD